MATWTREKESRTVRIKNVFHHRLGFYTGAIFTEEPTIERDAAPILKILEKIQPNVLTVAFDPEASGPDTHYKVLQAISEALKLGTTIILMNEGNIEQIGNKHDLVYRPKSEFVKEFFGIKGFKATLDEEYLTNIYEEILSGKRSLEELF